MRFYWTWKKVPGLAQLTRREYRQVLMHVGFKPYRYPRTWLGVLLASLIILMSGASWLSFVLIEGHETNALQENIRFGLVLIALLVARFVYLHFYLSSLRLLVNNVRQSAARSALRGFIVSKLLSVLAIVLVMAGMLVLDGTINAFDAKLDARVTEMRRVPAPVADIGNGFIAMTGMEASADRSSYEDGLAWVKAVNTVAQQGQREYPPVPAGLKHADFKLPAEIAAKVASIKSRAPINHELFCELGVNDCLNMANIAGSQINQWLSENRILLDRYRQLARYPDWQFAITSLNPSTPFPSYRSMLRSQNLLHAELLLQFEQGHVSKALESLAADMQFIRRLLGAHDILIGRMIATEMMARDLALLGDLMLNRPEQLKPFDAKIEAMLTPLEPDQLSLGNVMKLEVQSQMNFLSSLKASDLYEMSNVYSSNVEHESDNQSVWKKIAFYWTFHHLNRQATMNVIAKIWEEMIRQMTVQDAHFTRQITKEANTALLQYVPAWSGAYNQMGMILLVISQPTYAVYHNRLLDMNAMHAMMRARHRLAMHQVKPVAVVDYLRNAGNELHNPLTGQPFEWDAESKRIFYMPDTPKYAGRSSISVFPVQAK